MINVSGIMGDLEKVAHSGKLYLMNSAVMPAGCFGTYRYFPMAADTFGWYLKTQPVVSTIGYPQNVELLKEWFGVEVALNRVEVVLEPGDQVLVMRLKRRIADPTTKGAAVSNDISMWEFAHVVFE